MRTDPYRWMPIVLGVLVLGVMILAFQNHRLAQRVAALEEDVGEAEAVPADRRGDRGGRAGHERLETVDADGAVLVAREGRRRGRGRGAPTVDLGEDVAEQPTVSMEELMEDPEFQDRLGDLFDEYSSAERAERRERRTDYVQERIAETVSEFAAEHDLDGETEAQVAQILADHVTQRMELHDSIMEGDGDAAEQREQRDQLEEDTDAALIELLGRELFEELEDQMPGPPGRPR